MRRPRVPQQVVRVVVPVLGRVQFRRRRKLTHHQRWESALGSEVQFWDAYLEDMTRPDSLGRGYRDPTYSWADEAVYHRVIQQLPGERLEVLDVGAGPMTALPKVYPGKEIRITAFDPLADAYNARIDELALEPPVRTQASDGERILEHVEESSFDLAHASNCLDHAYDPRVVIRNMVLTVKPGGLVLLRHHRNEAVKQHYLGLHQWNFDVRDGEFVIWRPDEERNMSRDLADIAAGEVWLEGTELIWLLRRHADG